MDKNKGLLTSFLSGTAMLFDIAGVITFSEAKDGSSRNFLSKRDDGEAIRSDWKMVWKDLGTAFVELKDEQTGRAEPAAARPE